MKTVHDLLLWMEKERERNEEGCGIRQDIDDDEYNILLNKLFSLGFERGGPARKGVDDIDKLAFLTDGEWELLVKEFEVKVRVFGYDQKCLIDFLLNPNLPFQDCWVVKFIPPCGPLPSKILGVYKSLQEASQAQEGCPLVGGTYARYGCKNREQLLELIK